VTAVDGAILALVELAGDALPDVQVLDGWNGKTALDGLMLFIGFNPQLGTPAYFSTVDEDEGGLDATVETITVACTAAKWDGNLEFPSKRAELVALLGDLRDALTEDIDLGETVFDAWLVPTAQWYPVVQQATTDSPARANLQVDFTIRVRVHAP
jgi:hypothetical protein